MSEHKIAFVHTYLVVDRYSLKIVGFGDLQEARQIRDKENEKARQQNWPYNPPCSLVVVHEGEFIDIEKEVWRNKLMPTHGICSTCAQECKFDTEDEERCNNYVQTTKQCNPNSCSLVGKLQLKSDQWKTRAETAERMLDRAGMG